VVDRYYNSWIEDTDRAVEGDMSSEVSASLSEANKLAELPPQLPGAVDHVPDDTGHKSADNELSDWNMSTTPSVDDDDDDDDDDNDVFRSFR